MILVVSFFEISLSMDFVNALELVYFSFGILMVSLALYFGSKKPIKKFSEEKTTNNDAL